MRYNKLSGVLSALISGVKVIIMKNVAGQEYQTPRQTADQLDISPQTLRSYSGLVEKVTHRTDYFHRDQNNGRLYSAQNITDLAQVNIIKKEHNKTLKNAISEVFGQQIISEAPTSSTATPAKSTLPAEASAATPDNSTDNDNLAPVLYTLKQLSDQNTEVVGQLKKLQEQLDETNDKYEHLLKAIEVRKSTTSSEATTTANSAATTPANTEANNKPRTLADMQTQSTETKKGFWSRLFSRD